jgi:hypothetical protein
MFDSRAQVYGNPRFYDDFDRRYVLTHSPLLLISKRPAISQQPQTVSQPLSNNKKCRGLHKDKSKDFLPPTGLWEFKVQFNSALTDTEAR